MTDSETDSDFGLDESLSFKPFRAALYAMDREIAETIQSLKKLSNDHEDLYRSLKLDQKLQPLLHTWLKEGRLGPSGSWVVINASEAEQLGVKEGKQSIWNVFCNLFSRNE